MNVLMNLAEQVAHAEKAVADQLYWVKSKAERVEKNLESGGSHNSLGELQGAGAGLDTAVGRLEQAATCFSLAYGELESLLDADDRQWLDLVVSRSARLQALVR